MPFYDGLVLDYTKILSLAASSIPKASSSKCSIFRVIPDESLRRDVLICTNAFMHFELYSAHFIFSHSS